MAGALVMRTIFDCTTCENHGASITPTSAADMLLYLIPSGLNPTVLPSASLARVSVAHYSQFMSIIKSSCGLMCIKN